MRVVCLAGGVGGAKLAEGLQGALARGELTVVVNSGDDLERHSLTICPDFDTVLYTLAEVLRHLGILTQPFVPDAAAALLDQLAVASEARRFADLATPLMPGRALPAPHGIFPRFVETEAAGA